MDQISTSTELQHQFFDATYRPEEVTLARAMEAAVYRHPAMEELQAFGSSLQSRPLTKDELKIFFASLVAFVGDIPTGIVGLSLRMTDEWFKIDPLNATEIGASVLFAAVDEYGLHDVQRGPQATHHQMLLDTTKHWGIT